MYHSLYFVLSENHLRACGDAALSRYENINSLIQLLAKLFSQQPQTIRIPYTVVNFLKLLLSNFVFNIIFMKYIEIIIHHLRETSVSD